MAAGPSVMPKDLSPRVTANGGALPPMSSHAQNFEDVMLRRALQDIVDGFYIDAGAFEPDMHSVTQAFYATGWHGINVEPNPDVFARLAAARPRDVNLQLALSDANGTADFWLVGQTGVSSLHDPSALCEAHPHAFTASDRIRSLKVEVRTLADVIRTHAADRTVDFLKIDVEGAEAAVIRGADLHQNRPRIVLVEATRPLSQEAAWAEWEPDMLAAGYHFAWFDGLNRFYVRDEDRWRLAYFRLPACCFDNFRLVEAGAMARVQELQAALDAQAEELQRLRDELMTVTNSSAAVAQAPRKDMEFRVPVSLGELLDKISILEIKSERIVQEARLVNVRYELLLLSQERDRLLSPMPEALLELAAQLKAVNETIWDAEDVIHGEDYASLPEEVFVKQARIAFETNDTRARLKRKINDLVGSAVVEEKSYPDFGGAA